MNQKSLNLVFAAAIALAIVIEAVRLISGDPWPGMTSNTNWVDVILLPLWLAGIVAAFTRFRNYELFMLGSAGAAIMHGAVLLVFYSASQVGTEARSGLAFVVAGLVAGWAWKREGLNHHVPENGHEAPGYS